MEEMIKAVRSYASRHYDESGWDFVVETYTDDEIRGILEGSGAKTPEDAILEFGKVVDLLHDRRLARGS